MNKIIKKQSTHIVIFVCLLFVYLATRLGSLGSLPIFTDESIYIRWSQIGLHDAAHRFIPLTDGKPPFYHWLVMFTLNFIPDPLAAGRIVSVGAGFLNTILMWLVGFTLFKRVRLAHIAALFYVISPFMLMYDRLAIVDALLTTFGLASFWLAIILMRNLRLDVALLMGMSMGFGLLTKTAALFFILVSPGTLLLGDWSSKDRIKKFFNWLGLWAVSVVMAQVMFNALRLSNLFFRIEQKNTEFILTFSEFIQNPFVLFWGNAESLLKWQIGYLSIPITILILITLINFKNFREKLVLLGYFIGPFIAIAAFNKIIFARYLVFSTPFLLILAAAGIDELMNKAKHTNQALISLALFSLVPVINSTSVLVNPQWARIPQSDKDQYIQGKPSGIGVIEIVEEIRMQSIDQPVFLGTDGTFGLTPDAFDIYLRDEENLTIKGFYPVTTIPDEVSRQASQSATYFVYFNVQEIPEQENIELVQEHEKRTPGGVSYLRLYKILNQN